MLPATISLLPSPNLQPAAAVAWYLQNPLLLRTYANRMALTAAKVAAGGYSPAELHTLAVNLQVERNRIHLSAAVEPDNVEAEREVRGLLQSRHLSEAERKDCFYRLHTARPSEYAWLRGPIAAAIQSRGEAAMLAAAAKVSKATNTKIMRASELSVAA